MHLSELIKSLELIQHPEGGWFKETYTSEMTSSGRSIMSMIYYLLKKDEVSRWHRVTDADELWLWHLGDPLLLSYADNKSVNKKIKLGICGEHGGDPESINFCSKIGLDYISCSPYRVPIARLAAAQAEINKKK